MRGPLRILASLIFIVLISCSLNPKDKGEKSFKGFCDNELDLLISQDSIPKTDFNLFGIRHDTESKIERVFKEPYCKNLKFNISFQKDSLTTIPLTFNLLYAGDCELLPFIPRLFCHVLINNEGQVFVEDELCNIDSIEQKVFGFYDSEIVKKYSPNDFKRVFVSLLWDNDLDQKYFRKAINEILAGYIDFVGKISLSKYGKSICDLNNNELITIKELIPFNLRTDFYDGLEWFDFLPPSLPPVPVDSIEFE